MSTTKRAKEQKSPTLTLEAAPSAAPHAPAARAPVPTQAVLASALTIPAPDPQMPGRPPPAVMPPGWSCVAAAAMLLLVLGLGRSLGSVARLCRSRPPSEQLAAWYGLCLVCWPWCRGRSARVEIQCAGVGNVESRVVVVASRFDEFLESLARTNQAWVVTCRNGRCRS